MKKKAIQKLSLLLQGLALVLLTLFVQNLWHQHRSKGTPKQIQELCQLPPLPSQITVHYAHLEKEKDLTHLAFSISAPVEIMDAWLTQVDQWSSNPPREILKHSLQETQSGQRIHFNAEVRHEPLIPSLALRD